MNYLKQQVVVFLITLQFLTRLPVSGVLSFLTEKQTVFTSQQIAKTLKLYPLVGLIIGLILVLVSLLLQEVIDDHALLVAGLITFCWVYLSGGLHLDGVADMADAWIGGLGDKDKTLQILKDPYCGPFGVIAVTSVIVMKLIFCYEIIKDNFILLLLPPLMARIGVVVLIMMTDYVRKEGIARDLKSAEEKTANVTGILFFSGLAFYMLITFLAPMSAIAVILVSLFFFWRFRRVVVKRLSGITGDIAGAFIEYMELLILFCLTLLFAFI